MILWQPEQQDEPITPGEIIRYTRMWLHYGFIGFVLLCTVVGAVRGLFE